jgi:NADPH:quinone reductase-like Zn-dependent oxidoreductase
VTFVSMTMRAVVYRRYGSPEVLEVQEVEKPVPTDDEVLIKVCASSINVVTLFSYLFVFRYFPSWTKILIS